MNEKKFLAGNFRSENSKYDYRLYQMIVVIIILTYGVHILYAADT